MPVAAFIANQLLVFNPAFAPIWLAGLAAPFAAVRLRDVRFVSIAWTVAAIVTIATHGKDYYLAAAYPSLFALGGVAIADVVRNRVPLWSYVGASTVAALALAPLALPILAPATLIAYERSLRLAPQAQERGDTGRLPSTFADMLGWRAFARTVGTAYDALPSADRSRTSILVDNYGEAAALDVYGAPYGLPPALSGHNEYGLWALRGQRPRDLIRVGDDLAASKASCDRVVTVATVTGPYLRAFEQNRPVVVCKGLHPGLDVIWPRVRFVI